MVWAGERATGQRFVFQRFVQDSAVAACGIENLDADSGRHVVASGFVDGHPVALRSGLVGRWFVVLEVAFWIDGETERHGWHFCVERSVGVHAEGPDVLSFVLGDSEGASVGGEGDPVGAIDVRGSGDGLAGFAVDPGDLLCPGFGDVDEAVGGHGEVVRLHVGGDFLDCTGGRIDGDNAVLCALAGVQQSVWAELESADGFLDDFCAFSVGGADFVHGGGLHIGEVEVTVAVWAWSVSEAEFI